VPRETKSEPFEQLYARLEEAVAKLEAGGMPLEDAIALYEQGMTLARACQERLDEAELKITKLRESFAALSERAPSRLNDAPADYEFASSDGDGSDDERFED
jgi:exodeoxyribonuclease VII small subunit